MEHVDAMNYLLSHACPSRTDGETGVSHYRVFLCCYYLDIAAIKTEDGVYNQDTNTWTILPKYKILHVETITINRYGG